jgi:type IV pilus assembly protein PilW
MTTKTASAAPRGFTLLEVMIAATISLLVITAAVMVGAQLQRRGYMEERTVETQNAARAARDLMAMGVQRAGAGVGSLPLAVGTTPAGTADVRYVVWPSTNAQFTDGTFAQPTGRYAGLVSDALEVWETDPGKMVFLKECYGGSSSWVGSKLCTSDIPPASLAGRVVAVISPEFPSRIPICVGVVSAVDATVSPPTDNDYGLTWTPGVPGSPLPAGHPCASAPASPTGTIWATRSYVLPLSARAFRVNWTGGQPTLELDPDGRAGTQGYTAVSRDIEQLKVRMGVLPPDNMTDGGVLFFPSTSPARPALDKCTQATCAAFVTWDAGTLAGDEGLGSARDELMKRVRLVELDITARSQRLDTAATQRPDGGVDEDGNLMDGFKRRHSVVRLAPRNFGYSGQ